MTILCTEKALPWLDSFAVTSSSILDEPPSTDFIGTSSLSVRSIQSETLDPGEFALS